jgi:hypothetical protein
MLVRAASLILEAQQETFAREIEVTSNQQPARSVESALSAGEPCLSSRDNSPPKIFLQAKLNSNIESCFH